MRRNRFVDIEIRSWPRFLAWYSTFRKESDTPGHRWIFRGEGKLHDTLATSIEREAHAAEVPLSKLPKVEKQLINEFRRRLHHYSPDLPSPGDLAEWLSLMRHFGAPTRLLDWSYSPFVALFFAVEKAHRCDCAIWYLDSAPHTGPKVIKGLGKKAVDANFIKSRKRSKFTPEPSKRSQAAVIQYLFDLPRPTIVLVNPFRVSERTTIQQAVHLMPGDITKTFEANLEATSRSADTLTRLVLNMTPEFRKEVLVHLHRMNIDRATLFPGLQGFAESLQTRMAIPEALSW